MDELIIAGRAFTSRLMVGTGKFASNAAMVAAMEGSGSEIVTVALRRVDIDNPQDSLLRHIDNFNHEAALMEARRLATILELELHS